MKPTILTHRDRTLVLGLALCTIGMSMIGWRVSANDGSQRLVEQLKVWSAPASVARPVVAAASAKTATVTLPGSALDDLFWLDRSVANTKPGLRRALAGLAPNESGPGDPGAASMAAQLFPAAAMKSFDASSIPLNGTTQMRISIHNPNITGTLTGVNLTDTLPAGLIIINPSSGSVCGGTVTITSGSITFSNLSIPGFSSCTSTFIVQGTTPGEKLNTTSRPTSNESGLGNGATATLNVIGPPVVTKSFNPTSIPVGGISVLTFVASNPNAGTTLTNVNFTDTLPAGLIIASPNNITGFCTGGSAGVASGNSGGNQTSLSSATLVPNSSCTYSINVTATTAGAKVNSVTIMSNQGQGNTAQATLTVIAPPVVTKSFNPTSIPLGGTSRVSITVSNPNAGTTLTGVNFTDTLPAGLAFATPSALASTCDGVAVAATGPPASLSLLGGTLAAGASCTVSANVTGTTAGAKVNTTSAPTSNEGGTGTPATATLNVIAPPVVTKSFVLSSIPLNGTTTLDISIRNNNTIPLTGVNLTDTLPAGLIITTPPASIQFCGGTVTWTANSISVSNWTIGPNSGCVVLLQVQGTTAGAKVNTTSGPTSNEGGTGTTATATLNVIAPPVVTKSFNASSILLNGTASLNILIRNPNAVPLTGVDLTDTLPAGLILIDPFSGTLCGGTFTVTANSISFSNLTIPPNTGCGISGRVQGTTPGAKVNTTSGPTSNEGGTGTTATATLNVVAPPAVAKSFNPSAIDLGGVSQLTLSFNNPAGNLALTNLAVSDALPAGLTVAATPGLVNTCGGTVTGATAGSGIISLSGGALAAGASSCQIQVNVTSATPGPLINTTGNVTASGGGLNLTGNTAGATLTVNPVTSAPVITIRDPFSCTGPGDVLTVTVEITNPAIIAQPVTFTATLPAGLLALPGSATTSVPGTTVNVVNSSMVVFSGPLAAGETATVTYLAQVGDQVTPATTLCISTETTFSGVAGPTVEACATVDCSPIGPGLIPDARSPVSDQKAGSVLFYNIYTSSSDRTRENTRFSITNTNPSRPIYVHLFLVDGSSCGVADFFLCLTRNQTASFLASDLDPGTTGYMVAVATDRSGCPVNFNYLIGDAYVKFATGHAANLGAEAVSALAGGLPLCDSQSLTATLAFDGVSYNPVPRVLAADHLGSRSDGNDTLLIVNRVGGNLGTGAATLGSLFGILYDDAESGRSFSLTGGCQLRGSLSNSFPRTTPRYEEVIPAGHSGWMRLYAADEVGILGAMINYNAGAETGSGAFNQGHNLHQLTLTDRMRLTIPVFPPACQ